MKTPAAPWIDLALQQMQRGQRLAWFLYGCIEREQRLNLEACVAGWAAGITKSAGRSPPEDRVLLPARGAGPQPGRAELHPLQRRDGGSAGSNS